MKKAFLTVFLCLFLAGPSFAQNNIQAMRFLTINALMQYGQKLYDRGDFHEASAVFNHVLTYDSHEPQALWYLKNMGYSSIAIPSPAMHTQVTPLAVLVRNNLVDVSDTESLKKAIEAKKHIIEKLRSQIAEMRADVTSQANEK